jgi:hypothetical protein
LSRTARLSAAAANSEFRAARCACSARYALRASHAQCAAGHVHLPTMARRKAESPSALGVAFAITSGATPPPATKRNRPTCCTCAGGAMLPTPIGVSDAPLLGRAPPVSASCADNARHPRVASLDVFPRGGNSCERAWASRWLILGSQAVRTELEGRVCGHRYVQVRIGVVSCFVLDPGNENRVTMVVVSSSTWCGAEDCDDIGTRLPGRRQYKGGGEIVKRPSRDSFVTPSTAAQSAPPRYSDTSLPDRRARHLS